MRLAETIQAAMWVARGAKAAEACSGRKPETPMSLAEANECCGSADRQEAVCENCPLLIERREHPEVMRAARAM